MFLLLTRVLLWLLFAAFIYYVLVQLIPKKFYTWFGVVAAVIMLVLAFININDRIVAGIGNVISFPFKPVGMSILLLIFGLTGIKPKTKLINISGYVQIWAALLILLVSSIPFVADALAQQVQQEAVHTEQQLQAVAKGESVGAIVVLGGENTEVNLPFIRQIQLSDINDRLLRAAELYQRLPNHPLVIVTAVLALEVPGYPNTHSNDIRTLLKIFRVPEDKIIVEYTTINVHSSAEQVKKVLQEKNVSKQPIILISYPIISHRAILTFLNSDIKIIPAPSGLTKTPDLSLQLEDFIPNAAALTVTTRVAEEYIASIYYFLRGWLSPVIL